MLTEEETKCIAYVNSHLEEPLPEESLEFRTWKSCADLRDIDLFHHVAQALQQRELRLGFGGLFYTLRVPKYEGDEFGDWWSFSLVGDQDREFLQKYGMQYMVKPLHGK